jgi:hypothetical protein
MPTRKQRRRAQKSRRHEYEYVYVDEEGQEVEVDPAELKKSKPEKPAARNGKPATKSGRPIRAVPPPSWRRSAKRAALFGVFFILVFGLLLRNKGTGLASSVALAVAYTVAFIPVLYFTDRIAYRTYLRRIERAGESKPK